jgi:hypothetical protein
VEEQHKPEHRHDQRASDAFVIEQQMVEQNIYDYRPKNRQRQRNIAIDQQQRAANRLHCAGCFDDALLRSPESGRHFSVATTDFGKAQFFERDGGLYPLLQLSILGISVPSERTVMRQFEPLLNLGSRFFALV